MYHLPKEWGGWGDGGAARFRRGVSGAGGLLSRFSGHPGVFFLTIWLPKRASTVGLHIFSLFSYFLLCFLQKMRVCLFFRQPLVAEKACIPPLGRRVGGGTKTPPADLLTYLTKPCPCACTTSALSRPRGSAGPQSHLAPLLVHAAGVSPQRAPPRPQRWGGWVDQELSHQGCSPATQTSHAWLVHFQT